MFNLYLFQFINFHIAFLLFRVKSCSEILLKYLFAFVFVCLVAYAMPEIVESPIISDKLIQSAFYSGRKMNKIAYDDLVQLNISGGTMHSIPSTDPGDAEVMSDFHNYYSEYISTLEDEGKDVTSGQEGRDPRFDVHSQEYESKQKQQEEKIKFAKNLYKIYGNRTIFKVELHDLEKMVNSSILQEGQAIIFWEFLLQQKTDRLKSFYGKIAHEVSTECYLFNLIPLKALGLVFLSFVVMYTFMLRTYHSPMKNSFLFNLFGSVIAYYIIDGLFSWKYYLASSLLFVQFIFFLKCLLDSIIMNFGWNKEDYEIFAPTLYAKNSVQFYLKFFVLSLLTFLIGLFSISKFNFLLNYIFFYIALFSLVIYISNCFYLDVPNIIQPFRHILLFVLGLVNFLITKFHRKISKFSSLTYVYGTNTTPFYRGAVTPDNSSASSTTTSQNAAGYLAIASPDSLYLISEIFTFICFHYFNGYLGYQTNLSNSEKIKNKLPANSKLHKSFTSDDSLWIIAFMLGLLITLIGFLKNEYLTFILALYFFKMVLDIFGKVFNVKLIRVIYGILLFVLILFNQLISNKHDAYLHELFFHSSGVNSSTSTSFMKFIAKITGIIQILYLIFMNFDFIYTIYSEKNSELEEIAEEAAEEILRKVEIASKFDKKKNKKIRTFQIQVVRPEKVFSFMNIFYIHCDFYSNYLSICLLYYIIKDLEKNYIILILYAFLSIILLIRIYFIINEFKNDTEYLYSFMISFFIGIRLLTISRGYPTLYLTSCAYVLCLNLLYCMIDRRRLSVTLLLLFHLYSACVFLNSNFLFINIISLICLPITFYFMHSNPPRGDENSGEGKGNTFSFGFVFPAVVVLGFQLYGFKNILANMQMINAFLKSQLRGYDIFSFVQNIVQGNYWNEFAVIQSIYEFFLKQV